MSKLRSVTAGALATAMLATSVTPAMAQGYPGAYGYGRPGYGYNHDRYRHRRHNDNTGAVVAGVIGVGILAAIIASAASNKNRTQGGYATQGNIRTDDQAADSCASAAEQQLGGSARVSAITDVSRVADGYNVRGIVDYGRNSSSRNDSWRGGGSGDERGFSCSVRYGNIQRVDFGG